MEPLSRLVYVSHALGSALGVAAQIVRDSAPRNAQLGITGVLSTTGDRFLQVLEGRQGAVDGLFERIRMDPRHRDVRLLLHEPIAFRLWPDWGMRLMANARLAGHLYEWGLGYEDVFAGRAPAPLLVGLMHALSAASEEAVPA